MSILRALWLGGMLLFAQTGLAAHGIEHALHDHEAACVACLAMPGFAAVPMSPAHGVAAIAVSEPCPRAVPLAPTFPSPLPFRSRAPPVLQSR